MKSLPRVALAALAATALLDGRLASGSTWAIDVPADWNGDLVPFSHGYRTGPDNPLRDVNFTPTADALQARGYAVAQASYSRLGWALETAVDDQLGTLAVFTDKVGAPRRTIALGRSMGGLISSLLAERPDAKIDGALSTCGLLGGGQAAFEHEVADVLEGSGLCQLDGGVLAEVVEALAPAHVPGCGVGDHDALESRRGDEWLGLVHAASVT